MKRKAWIIGMLAVLALALALPASAQKVTPGRRPTVQQPEPLRVIALQTRVEGRSQLYAVGDGIPVREGERLRVDLVGTALVNGSGTERPINASFRVAAGKERLDIVQTGPNWVVVQVGRRGGNNLAQLEFDVNGNYEMKGGLRGGRITFEIGEGSVGQGSQPIVRQDERWRKAQDLNAMLYRTILREEPRGTRAENDMEHIYRLGYGGVRDVALELADEVDEDYRRLSEQEAVEVLGDLYRGLLRRNASDRDFWEDDPGFRGNIRTLRDRGLVRMVEVIVDSEEFRSVHQLYRWGSLTGDQLPEGYSSESWRRERRSAIRY